MKRYIPIISLILLMSLLVYKNFLFFGNLYLYSDIGGDTMYYVWPLLLDISEQLRTAGLSFWSFNIGLGTNIFALNQILFDPFNWILFAGSKAELTYMLPYVAILKILLAGFIFYKYLSLLKVTEYTALMCSFLFAFNGYIILWGQHYGFATAIVLLAFVLYSFEKWLLNASWKPFVLSILLLSASSYYFLYMISFMLLIYALFRYATEKGFTVRGVWTFFVKTSGLYLLGIGLSAVILFPSVGVALESPRVGGSIVPLFQLNTPAYYITLVSRFFSNNLTIGPNFHFYDWRNYYEVPNVYAGLLTLLLIPQIYACLNPQKRKIYVIFTIIFYVLLLLPFFSSLLNAFSYISYRWTFMIIAFTLFLAAQALNILDKESFLNIRLLLGTFISLLAISILSISVGSYLFNWPHLSIISYINSLKYIAIYLFLYTLLLYMFKIQSYKNLAKVLLLVLVCTEIYGSANTDVNQRSVLNADYITNKQGYFDRTNDAIQYLKTVDKSFYRINKTYLSAGWNDPSGQDYYGTTAYLSLNSPSYLKFINQMQIEYPNKNVVKIPTDRYLLSSLVGVKYFLTKGDEEPPFGYQYLATFGDVKLLENKYFLPLGVTYDHYITQKDFNRLSAFEKDQTILKYFVVDNDTKVPGSFTSYTPTQEPTEGAFRVVPVTSNLQFGNIDRIVNKFPQFLNINAVNQDPNIIIPLKETISGRIKVFAVITSMSDTTGQLFWRTESEDFQEAKSKFFPIAKGSHKYEIDLGYNYSVRTVRFDIGTSPGKFVIKDFSLKCQDIVFNQKEYIDSIKKLMYYPFNIENWTASHFKGSITVDKDMLLAFPIPFDKGWKIKVNGRQGDLRHINVGFMGIFLTKGHNLIELDFVPPYLVLGSFVTLISLVLLILLLFLRNNPKRRERTNIPGGQ